jgi:GTPase SAR1 family protein
MSLKVILVGDSEAGKTTLLMKFLGNSSLSGIPSTTSPLFFHREIPVNDTFVSAEI